MYRPLILCILIFASHILSSQAGQSKKELLELLKTSPADTTLLDAYNDLTWPVYSYDNPDSSIYFGEKAIELATRIKDIKRLSIAHRRIGITYINKGDIFKAINHQHESYELSKKINYRRGMQLALNNIGVAYFNNEVLGKALPYFLRSLKLAEEAKDYSAAAANLYINCGMIYIRTGDNKRAIEYFLKAKHLGNEIQDDNSIIVSDCNLSTYYRNINRLDSARWYLEDAKKYLSDNAPTTTKFMYYLDEGLVFSFSGEHDKALQSFLDTQPYATVVSDQITLLINIAEENHKLNRIDKALKYYKDAFELSKKNRLYDNLEYISESMARVYESMNDNKKQILMLKQHVAFKDSNARVSKVQQIFRQQLEFDYERKQVADSIRFEQKEHLKNVELEMAAAKLNKAKVIRIMLVVILVIIVLFSIFIFNRFMITNKQNKIIEHQKQLVEHKNREIVDSINYAKRLQTAILPQLKDIKKELDLDILYLPKDIIGGDFYFFEKRGDHTFFAICDCTGHGIPGAIMSVVCHQALEKSIKEFHLKEPALILSKTRELVIESLNATHQNIKDGMDCSLIVIDHKNKSIQWAGANNHIWRLNNGVFDEIKADKQPVAFYENSQDFTNRVVNTDSGSFIYLFTDGYGDQFGGPKGKKYKNKALKEFLISVSDHSVSKQVEFLHQNFFGWKGELDQVDDVTIAIIRIA
jgi:serine phosphatase RsbU (regulator of sigma subunit)